MKLIMLLAVVLFTSNATYCQTAVATPEQVVARVIDSGTYDGITDKEVSRLGDAAAVAVTKAIGDKFLNQQALTASDIGNVLLVFHLAFAAPVIVANPSDRQPKTTLFVLQSLTALTNDSALRS